MSPRHAVLILLAVMIVLPGAGALVPAPNVAVPTLSVKIPDMGLDPLLVPQAQAASVTFKDGVLTVTGLDAQVVALEGALRVTVPWTLNQSVPLPDGYYRALDVSISVVDGDAQVGADAVHREWTNATNRDSGTMSTLVHLSGLTARHVISVNVYASWYSSYPYQNGQQSGIGTVVATGAPQVVTNEVTTAPRFVGADFLATDTRDANFQPSTTMRTTFHDVTVVAPDRFVVTQVPYRFLRNTYEYGYGYEYGYVYAYALDEHGNYLGGNGMSWYVNHDSNGRLSMDLRGSLDVFLQFQSSWSPQHAVRLYVSSYWYGYVCTPSQGCPWFGFGSSDIGDAGLVYAPPDRLVSPDEAVSTALHLV